MVAACGTRGREERCIQSFCGETERDHLEDLGVDGRIILRRMCRKWDGNVYCIDLAQDGERWWADVQGNEFLYFVDLGLSTMIDFFFTNLIHKFSSRNLCTEQSPAESDDTRCCTNTICPPEDEHNSARNM